MREAFRTVRPAVGKHLPLDVLKCVRIAAREGRATLTAHNMTFGLTASADYDGVPFACCVNAERLGVALERLAAPQFRLTGKQLTISAGRARVTLPVLPYEDFPEFAAPAGERIALPVRIGPLIQRVSYAVPTQDVRFYLVGVCLDVADGRAHVIASDGHRLAVASSPCPGGHTVEAIIPRDTLASLAALDLESVEIAADASGGRMLVAQKGGIVLTSKLIDGKYVLWRRVLPEPPNTLQVARQALAEAIDLVAPFSDEKFSAVRLRIDRDTLCLATTEQDQGAQVEIACEADASCAIGFNVHYVREAVKSLSAERLAIRFADPTTSIRIDEGDYTAIIMPMRT